MANILDTFTRANESPIASPWAGDAADAQPADLVSNEFTCGATANTRSLSARTDSSANYAEVTLGTIGRNDAGPAIHCDLVGSWYYASLFLSGGVYKTFVGYRSASAWTNVYYTGADSGVTPVPGMKLRLYRSGSDLVFDYYDGAAWVNLATAADTTLSGGYDGAFIGTSGGNNDATTFTDWANYDTEASAGQTISVGLSAETDSAFSIAHKKSKAAGLCTETDSVFAVTKAKRKAVGLNTEADTALGLAKLKRTGLGLCTETDSALQLGQRQLIAVGLASETDSALAVAKRKARAVGICIETATAFAHTWRKVKAIGLSSEADTALAARAVRRYAMGLTSETDSAFALVRKKARAIGLCTESDSAFGVVGGAAAQGRRRFVSLLLGGVNRFFTGRAN